MEREGIEKVLLADMDILYSRKIEGGLVIIGFLGGGGGLMLVDFGLGDGREWGWGWAELSKCSSAVHQQQQLKKCKEPEMKKCLESVFDMADVLFGLCFTIYKQALLGR